MLRSKKGRGDGRGRNCRGERKGEYRGKEWEGRGKGGASSGRDALFPVAFGRKRAGEMQFCASRVELFHFLWP